MNIKSTLSFLILGIVVSSCGGGGSDPTVEQIEAGPGINTVARTGQTQCYDAAGSIISCTDTGQDGELLSGAAWPSPRFIANTDTTITDNLTGLMWEADGNLMLLRDASFDTDNIANDGFVTWDTALAYIAKLNTENYLGYSDWRLPNINELRSLSNHGHTNSATWLSESTQHFNNILPFNYWSSTTYTGSALIGSGNAWVFDFKYDSSLVFPKSGSQFGLMLPVRTATSPLGTTITLPRTGQNKCYDATLNVINCAGTGQDGELQAGAIWPTTRFITNIDTSISDKLTSLTWAPQGNLIVTRDSGYDTDGFVNDGAVYWQTALNYVDKLNAELYLGYNDWRMPNANELLSLWNAQFYTTIWLPTQGFSDIQFYAYWSSTSQSAFNERAWVLFPNGELKIAVKQDINFQFSLLPVRGGQ